MPDNPRAWLLTVATRRLTDGLAPRPRARREREAAVAAKDPSVEPLPGSASDDTLTLLYLCCHPALSPPSQVAR